MFEEFWIPTLILIIIVYVERSYLILKENPTEINYVTNKLHELAIIN